MRSKALHVNARHHLQKSRILLVDDNDLNREIAITLLEDEGLTVEYAVDGCEAVEKIMNSPAGHYQLVLMDVQMPVMNGYEATKAIRRLSDPTRAQGAHFGHDRRRLRGRPPEGAAQRHGRPPLQAHRD